MRDTQHAMSDENVEVMRRMYEAWLRKDPASLDALDPEIELYPDPEAYWVGVNRTYRGHDGIGEYMRSVYEAFEDYHPEIEKLLDAGDKVVTLAVERGRGRGSGAEVLEARTAHVWTMRNGKAIRLDLYLDRKRALEEVGLPE
jgi:ketosteroid isomerase-like protein